MDLTTLIAAIASVPYIGPVAIYIPAVITIGAVVAVFLPAPQPSASVVYKALYALVQWCALNKGHGVNLSDPASAGIVGGPSATSAPHIAVTSVPLADPTATPGPVINGTPIPVGVIGRPVPPA
jgi:hypothetical protein